MNSLADLLRRFIPRHLELSYAFLLSDGSVVRGQVIETSDHAIVVGGQSIVWDRITGFSGANADFSRAIEALTRTGASDERSAA